MSLSVLTIFGTRPEAIKMAPVALSLAADERFDARICVTAQHREMLDAVLDLFGLVPDFDLNLMRPGQDLFDITSRALLGLRDVLRKARPDIVLVHGDTTTSMVGALAAYYEAIPVAHVEAGLRTFDKRRPFPEEINRGIVSRLADLHFAPTEGARDNLLREGIDERNVTVTGNTVIDALQLCLARVRDLTCEHWSKELGSRASAALEAGPKRTILITGHRRESFGRGMRDICAAIELAAERHRDWCFIYAVHPNPNVAGPVEASLSGLPNVFLIEPLDYAPFVWLMNRCDLILTDSGGIQEEAPALGKPVLVTREVTERPEAVAAGTVRLVGTDPVRILSSLEEILLDEQLYARMSRSHNPYGDGRATERILAGLGALLGFDNKVHALETSA